MQRKEEIPDALRRVAVTGGFWGRMIERNRTATLPHALRQCDEAGYVRNLEIAAGRRVGQHRGGSHEDSDLYKVVEGICYTMAPSRDEGLSGRLDELIDLIAAAQEPDGYLNSYYTAHREQQRYSDLHRSHELYCAGHLFEAAVAHFEGTGKRALLDVAARLADHLDATFGAGKLETVPGHQEVELALVRLSKATGDRRYLDLARYFVDLRGDPERVRREYAGKPVIDSERHPGRNRPPAYRQDHAPAVDQREPTGHAVRAGYFYAAMADVAMAYGSETHAVAVNALWENIVAKHLYLTGGVGTHQHRDEGFGDPYLLPNDTAYCETCGGIALLLFSHRVGLLNGEARCADLVETILYNHLLSCPDHEGVRFHYRNPMESDGDRRRHPWPNPACCPTNIVRLIPQIARFVYAVKDDTLFVEQFVGSDAELLLDGKRLRVRQDTNYPWDGRIDISVDPETPRELALHVRIPGWVEGRPLPGDLYAAADGPQATPAVAVNGEPVDAARRTKGYCVIHRPWREGDRVTIELPMPVRRIRAHENVEADRGRVALMRGPLVYCVEAADHDVDLDAIALAADTDLVAAHRPDFLGGVTIVCALGGPLTAVPYYAWNNREPGKMRVWLREGGKGQAAGGEGCVAP